MHRLKTSHGLAVSLTLILTGTRGRRNRNQLRREQGAAVHAARSLAFGRRQSRDRRGDVADAPARNPRPVGRKTSTASRPEGRRRCISRSTQSLPTH